VVIVPTGVLHRLPWGVLGSCRGRPVTVSPSATHWLLASEKVPAAPNGSSLLVAGPGCDSAAQEVAELPPLVRRATCLVGGEATVARVTEGLGGATMAHIVAHGTFRRDNPLFSSIRLADGPLTVYDLERLGQVPSLMVLSACDGGISAVTAGDELSGLASALLALDARTVVASVTSVPDDLTRRLMVELHRRLGCGAEPAAALAAARDDVEADVGGSDPRVHALAGFSCFGGG
ncbi:MAG TPA: CHAT domain-containing protein, partial [Acidimicrobiales bacterium]|nr:CHAT domain-containing protein [Acidimicrobiales bacterium]